MFEVLSSKSKMLFLLSSSEDAHSGQHLATSIQWHNQWFFLKFCPFLRFLLSLWNCVSDTVLPQSPRVRALQEVMYAEDCTVLKEGTWHEGNAPGD